jgi:hypothetical protein
MTISECLFRIHSTLGFPEREDNTQNSNNEKESKEE